MPQCKCGAEMQCIGVHEESPDYRKWVCPDCGLKQTKDERIKELEEQIAHDKKWKLINWWTTIIGSLIALVILLYGILSRV